MVKARSAFVTNHELARPLVQQGLLNLKWDERLDRAPPPLPPGSIDLVDKVEGMMRGMAISDGAVRSGAPRPRPAGGYPAGRDHTRDNDAHGAIVGAAVGALHGARALPQAWVDGLAGRLGADDDDRLFDVPARACARFGIGSSATVRQRAARFAARQRP